MKRDTTSSLAALPAFSEAQTAVLNSVLDKQKVGYMIEGDGSTVFLLVRHWKYLDIREARRVPLFKSREKFKAIYVYGKL